MDTMAIKNLKSQGLNKEMRLLNSGFTVPDKVAADLHKVMNEVLDKHIEALEGGIKKAVTL